MTDTLTTPPPLPGGFAAISKYNPHLWTPDQLRAIFVARQRELADLTQTLVSLKSGDVGQHCLLVGARGMGKSTLMQRLALAVEDDAKLRAAWLPLRFPEEQYTVNTLAQFWANVLDSLADALERRGEATEAIDSTAARLGALSVAEQAIATLQAIRDISRERGQRLLLLVDNTDLLLHNIGPKGQWALRQVLQSEPQLLWVGGSYQSLEANSQYHDAFLDFFRIIELRPLTLDEMRDALLALAQTFGGESARSNLLAQLQKQPERLPTLRLLSGGNPRTTVMLYELLASGQAGHVRSDLEALLDSMTPLYKARLDALADLPRKLLAHILGHWAPMSLAQLAEASQVAKTTISPQLQRLELEGLIQKTKLHGTTRSGYQAAERFFNIWYLMRLSPRRQRTRLGWLVEFMRLWFSGEELCDLARTRMTSSHADNPHEWDYDSALADALPDGTPEKHGLRWSLLKQLQTQREALSHVFDFDGVDRDFKSAEDYLRRAQALPERLRHCPHPKSDADQQHWVESVLGSLQLTLEEKELVADRSAKLSLARYEGLLKVLEKESEEWSSDREKEALTVIRSKVLSMDFFPDMPDSELTYRQIRHEFMHHAEALLATAMLHNKKYEDEWALRSLELAQAVHPKNANLAFLRARILHTRFGRYKEAEHAYRQAVFLDGKNAYYWHGLGTQLLQMDRYEEAEQAYRQAIAINGEFADSWYGLGYVLNEPRMGRYDEAKQAYRQAIALDEKFALPWNGLGNLLQRHGGQYYEAEQAYRQAIALDEKFALPWNGMGALHRTMGRYDEAERAYRQAIALDKKYASPWKNLGNLLQLHMGRYDEAEQAYRQAISLDEKVSSSWNDLGTLLQQHLGRYNEAEQAYRQAISLDEKNACPLGNLAQLLWDQGRQVEARAHYERCIQVAERQIPKPDGLLLQAHLVFNNQQLAQQALDRLAESAQQGDASASYQLRQQVLEVIHMGLGERLADWMQQSQQSPYLQPMIQALYTLAGAESKLQDLPAEIQQMADAVVQEAQKRLRRGDATNNKPATQ